MISILILTKKKKSLNYASPHLEIISVIGVGHEIPLVGTLQLETVCDTAIRLAVFAVATEVG